MEYQSAEKTSAVERRAFEARLTVDLIQERLAKGVPASSIALLLRKISGNEVFLEAMAQAEIPYALSSSGGFFEQSIVLDAIVLLKAIQEPENDLAITAMLRSPWWAASDQELFDWARGRGQESLLSRIPGALREWLEKLRQESLFRPWSAILNLAFSYYPRDLKNDLQVQKLVELVAKMEGEGKSHSKILADLADFCGWAAEEDLRDERVMPSPGGKDAIQVLTIHAAKGLEFSTVILGDLDSRPNRERSPLRILAGVGIALKLEEEEEKTPEFVTLDEENKLRDKAESKLLFYVAITRAQEEEIFLCEKKERAEKLESWGDYLRATDLEELVSRRTIPMESASLRSVQMGPAQELPAKVKLLLTDPKCTFVDTSVSELAAYLFCGEFHRLKYVQKWDDRVVSLWPVDGKLKRVEQKDKSPESREVERLLKKLKIEKKERGIALHRVLERTVSGNLESTKLWLREAYLAQGVSPYCEELEQLLDFDGTVLERFLSSTLGQELFSPQVKAFPEIVFQWKLHNVLIHGTMDRLVERGSGDYLVVDYKSSVLEESLERYQFQVGLYALAIHESTGKPVSGTLVDLFTSATIPVTVNFSKLQAEVKLLLSQVEANYLLPKENLDLPARGISGGDHCFSCPYSQHCEIGRTYVLAFTHR